MKPMRAAALIAAALPLVAAAQTPRTTPLNRTVIVVPNPNAVLAVECEQGLAPQPQPRVTAEERAAVAPVAVPQPPPAADLRGTLQSAVDAAQKNDRQTFAARLARAKEILATYPPGGERNAASDVVAVLDDIDTLWNSELSSPTGAFFDGSSDLHRTLAKYPGYEEAVRRQVITDQNGVRFYPARESRDFLAGEAATRLGRLTGHAPEPRLLRQKEPQVTEQRAPEKAKPVTKTTRTHPRHVEHKAKTTEAHATKPKTTKTKVVGHKPVARHAEAAPVQKPAPTATAASAPVPASTQPAVTASTASTAPVTTTTQAPPPPAPATSATETTATQAQQPAPVSHSNLIIPIILIILGVGVLVLFSRSSNA